VRQLHTTNSQHSRLPSSARRQRPIGTSQLVALRAHRHGPPPPPPLTCGRPVLPPSGARIVGGDESRARSWPWQIALRNRNARSSRCAGSLIAAQWVLTTAHCVDQLVWSSDCISVVKHSIIGKRRRRGLRKLGAGSGSFPIDKLLEWRLAIEEFNGAQNFNVAPKFPENRGFSALKCTYFFEENSPTRKIFILLPRSHWLRLFDNPTVYGLIVICH